MENSNGSQPNLTQMDDLFRSIPATIDRLLLEQGVYAPVELLLALGRLPFEEYEAWRYMRLTTLEHVLNDEQLSVAKLLEEAAVHARALGLVPEKVSHERWIDSVSGPLRAFRNDDLETVWCTHYRPRTDNTQMDLFIDNVEAALVKGVSNALVARQGEETDRLLNLLHSHNPQSSQLDALVTLRAAQRRFSVSSFDADHALKEMQRSIVPLATRALQSARDYLIPLWRGVAHAMRHSRFDAQRSESHRSYAALMGMDWMGVRESVEQEPHWRCHPILQLRRAIALDEQRLGDAARDAWFELCWCFPQQAAATFRTGRYPLDQRRYSWQVFEDLDPPLAVTDYPAWQLLVRPDVSSVVREPSTQNSPALRPFSLVRQLLVHRQDRTAVPDQQELALRAALKQANEALFEHFMRLHAAGH